jgi:hypothetical protein
MMTNSPVELNLPGDLQSYVNELKDIVQKENYLYEKDLLDRLETHCVTGTALIDH